MSVAVMQNPSAGCHFHQCSWPAPAGQVGGDEQRPWQFDVWNSIHSHKAADAADDPKVPYVHPLVRRSFTGFSMSEKSLETCTESLGSETGSDDFTSSINHLGYSCHENDAEKMIDVDEKQTEEGGGTWSQGDGEELTSVNYHCSTRSKFTPRLFPPPLPSISRRDVPCVHLRSHRRDGRLVVEAIPVSSHNYLHARRVDGRLLLSFVDTVSNSVPALQSPQPEEEEEEEKEEEEEEEEEAAAAEEEEEEEEEEEVVVVEVVDKGTVIEVKVNPPPQQRSGTMRAHRSSLVINKFVGGAPASSHTESERTAAVVSTLRESTYECSDDSGGHRLLAPENKLLFVSKRRNREEFLRDMRRCSDLRRPWFIWEPCCIATSS